MAQLGKGRVLRVKSRSWPAPGREGEIVRLGRAGDNGTVVDRILKAVQRAPGCQLDHLAISLPDLTWNQVFLEVDRMSRTGQVRVQSQGNGDYTLALPTAAAMKPKASGRGARNGARASRT